MYTVRCVTDGEEYMLHHPLDRDAQLVSPTLDLEMGTSGTFSFHVPVSHPYRDKIRPLSSEVSVYQDDELLFCGRPIGREDDFYLTGKIDCEGELAYLVDSLQRPYDFQGGITEFLTQCLSVHNSQVEARKQFLVGSVTVVDNNNYIHRSNSDISNTLDALTEKLVDTHGGYLRIRHADGKKYLDYVTDYGGINSQSLVFGENILSLSKKVDPTGIITALIPQGAELEEDGSIVDITSVNSGVDYIYDAAAVVEYGWIWGRRQWEDVTLPQNLLTKARTYLTECISLPTTITLKAVDLSLIDVDLERLKLGWWTTVSSPPHGISAEFVISQMHIDLSNLTNSSITLGRTLPTYTAEAGKQLKEVSKKVEQVASTLNPIVEEAVENATQLITGGLGGYIVISRAAADGHPEEILVMDAPAKENAVNVLRLNRNGIGFSNSGYNGVYRNAWTIDGQLVADWITAGTMFADRIKGGTLTLGGSGNINGIFKILNASGNQIGTWNKDGLSLVGGKRQNTSTKTYSQNNIGINPSATNAVVITGNVSNTDGTNVRTMKTALGSGGVDVFENADETGWHVYIWDDGVYVQGDTRDDVANYSTDCSAMNGYFDGDLEAYGEKNRVVRTADYGERKLSAYETASPMFGDIGSGEVGVDGRCYISVDSIFAQTVNLGCEYQIFLQKYGSGDVWVSERGPAFFVVSGTPGLQFGWELKARQAGYEQNRLDAKIGQMKAERTDYAAAGAIYYKNYQEGLL